MFRDWLKSFIYLSFINNWKSIILHKIWFFCNGNCTETVENFLPCSDRFLIANLSSRSNCLLDVSTSSGPQNIPGRSLLFNFLWFFKFGLKQGSLCVLLDWDTFPKKNNASSIKRFWFLTFIIASSLNLPCTSYAVDRLIFLNSGFLFYRSFEAPSSIRVMQMADRIVKMEKLPTVFLFFNTHTPL